MPPPDDIDLQGPPIQPRAIDVGTKRENTRTLLAFFLVLIFAIEIILALVVIYFPGPTVNNVDNIGRIKDILSVVFGPTVALVGSAIGFYFGTTPESGSKP